MLSYWSDRIECRNFIGTHRIEAEEILKPKLSKMTYINMQQFGIYLDVLFLRFLSKNEYSLSVCHTSTLHLSQQNRIIHIFNLVNVIIFDCSKVKCHFGSSFVFFPLKRSIVIGATWFMSSNDYIMSDVIWITSTVSRLFVIKWFFLSDKNIPEKIS